MSRHDIGRDGDARYSILARKVKSELIAEIISLQRGLALRDAALREAHNRITALEEVATAAREAKEAHYRFARIGDPIQARMAAALTKLDTIPVGPRQECEKDD